MRRAGRRRVMPRLASFCLAFLLALSACAPAPEGWTPLMEETSTSFLRRETESVAGRVRLASEQLGSSPEDAAAELAEAAAELDGLLTYYLPLLEAREAAYNAYRHHYLGETHQVTKELDTIERLLMGVAAGHDGRLVLAMEEPLEALESARAALGANPDEAMRVLQALGTKLNSLLLKGELVLAGNSPAP